jgi:hypothetical protein
MERRGSNSKFLDFYHHREISDRASAAESQIFLRTKTFQFEPKELKIYLKRRIFLGSDHGQGQIPGFLGLSFKKFAAFLRNT